jgi:transposase
MSTDKNTPSTEALQAQIDDLCQRLDVANKAIAEGKQELAWYKARIEWFMRHTFGRSSEKLVNLVDQRQQTLFGAEEEADTTSEAPKTETVTYTRRKKSRIETVTDTGLRFGPDVPVKVIRSELPEGCTEDDVIDWRLTRRLAQVSSSYTILEYQHPVIKHPETHQVITTPAPAGLFPGSFADFSVIAGMMIGKFVDYLPLYRQHQRLARAGITISRSSMVTLLNRSISLLAPIAEAQFKHILGSRVLTVDETPIQVGPGKDGKLKQGWFWPIHGEDNEVHFLYDPSRSTRVISEVIGSEFNGVLLTDGYTVYNRLAIQRPNITHAMCWVHIRRRFVDAVDADPAAKVCLEHIAALYRGEAAIREQGLEGAEKLAARNEKCLPAAMAFWQVCEEQLQRVELEPRHPLMVALGYAWKRRDALMVAFANPDVPFDTNHVERTIRPIALGKKNFLFAGNEIGARHIGIAHSLLASC